MVTVPQESRHPNAGERAPDLSIVRADTGETLTLSRLWQGGPAVLVFLRHLGCAFCREQVSELRKDADEFIALNATIGLITIGQALDTAAFCAERDLTNPFVCLSDPEKNVYRAYGLQRGVSSELFSPNVWRRGFQAALHGHIAGLPKTDPYQMPGVFIVDRDGYVRFAHRHADVADNPRNSELLAVLAPLS